MAVLAQRLQWIRHEAGEISTMLLNVIGGKLLQHRRLSLPTNDVIAALLPRLSQADARYAGDQRIDLIGVEATVFEQGTGDESDLRFRIAH